MGCWFLVIVVIVGLWFILFKKQENNPPKPVIRSIQKTSTIHEMIASIDYGRVYPFYTGMSLTEVRDLVKFSYVGRLKMDIDKELKCYDKTRLVSLRNTLNPHIDNIILGFSENNVIDSINIVIKDFAESGALLKELMCAKFGTHTPTDGRHVAWRDMRMIIRIDEIDGVIEVFYIKSPLGDAYAL